MKNRKERIMEKLTDLLTGGKNIKAKRLYRGLVDFVVLGTLWLVIVILSIFCHSFFSRFLSFAFLSSSNFFILFLFVPGYLLTNKYLLHVDKLRKGRDNESFIDTHD